MHFSHALPFFTYIKVSYWPFLFLKAFELGVHKCIYYML